MSRDAMLHGPILATLLRLALPTIVVLVAQTMVGIAETYYVSRLGTDALIGVALVFPILMLMTMTANGGIGGGVASAVARAIGGGRHADAEALLRHAVILAVTLGLAFCLALTLVGPALYHALGGRYGALGAAVSYSTWVFAGSVPIWTVSLVAAALRGAGNVRVPARVTLLGAVLLIPLSPLFIFGFGRFGGFGVAGAGIAVTTYYSLAAVVLLVYVASGRSGLRLRRGPVALRHFRDILGVGLISSLSAIQLNATVILVTAAVGRFGASALAGYGMGSRLDYLLIPLLFGLGTGVLTMVGVNMGAGDRERAKRVAWTGTALGAGFVELIGLAAAIFPHAWLGLFSRQPEALAAGTLYLRTVAPFYGAVGVVFILSFASQGGGRPIWPMAAGTARLAIAAGAGTIGVLYLSFGLSALFVVIALSSLTAAAICITATAAGATWRPARIQPLAPL